MNESKITECLFCKKIKRCMYDGVIAIIASVNFSIPGSGLSGFINRRVEGYFCGSCRRKSPSEIFCKLGSPSAADLYGANMWKRRRTIEISK